MKARSALTRVLKYIGIPLVALLHLWLAGCGGSSENGLAPPLVSRQSVVWLTEEGIDSDTARHLKRAGVDLIMVRLGSVRLSSDVPVPMLVPVPPLAGDIDVGIALQIEQAKPEIEPSQAKVLWQALDEALGDLQPTEIALQLPEVRGGLQEFVDRLGRESGLKVLPVLTVDQLIIPEAIELVQAAKGCVVIAYGNPVLLRPNASLSLEPLPEQLAPLRDLGVRVRVGMVLGPHTMPQLDSNAEDVNPLTENNLTEIKTAGQFDRVFAFREAATWSGRTWNPGDQIAMRWIDAARLDAALNEVNRLSLPEPGGWDLISLPPETSSYPGMTRETLWRYLSGDGPEPQVKVSIERAGSSFRIHFVNTGPFCPTVSSFENWLEVTVTSGYLIAEEPGAFDLLQRGNRNGDHWQEAVMGNVGSARFVEKYLGPYERLQTEWMRAVSTQAEVLVRWQLVLSNGKKVLSGDIPYDQLPEHS
jgi:hypothetical protein